MTGPNEGGFLAVPMVRRRLEGSRFQPSLPVAVGVIVGGTYALSRGAALFEAIVIGIAVASVVGIAPWVLRQPRPRAWLRRYLPTIPKLLGAPSLSSISEPTWEKEFLEFRNKAAYLWRELSKRFRYKGTPAQPWALQATVLKAPWPDTKPDNVSSDWLAEFSGIVYGADRSSVFDDADFELFDTRRRETTNILMVWAERLHSKEDQGFTSWVYRSVRPNNERTIRLLWYLEIALAKSIGNDEPDFTMFQTIRDAMSRD